MSDKIDYGLADRVVKILGKEGVGSLSDEEKSELIKALKEENKTDKGFFANIFGTNSENAVIYITLVFCALLIIVGVWIIYVYKEFASEYWKLLFPVITGALGYMYGKGKKDQ